MARFNVRRNDGTRIFQLSGNVSDALIERNVVHVGKGRDVQMIVATEWNGCARDVRFYDDALKVAGTALWPPQRAGL